MNATQKKRLASAIRAATKLKGDLRALWINEVFNSPEENKLEAAMNISDGLILLLDSINERA